MNKEKRRKRYEINVKKEINYKNREWNKGRLILKKPLDSPYLHEDICLALEKRLVDCIKAEKQEVLSSFSNSGLTAQQITEMIIKRYRKYKQKSIYLILHYNPTLKKTKNYQYLKVALETYWDNKNNLINVL